ncbi:amino acid adenylation domain-containing protein, partial [Paenibacillus sp. SI8]|uniref:amino acid adenylation domain-containing protein n=1 Tax=unclassified Paenibacillus TaxID=185978 RepID=UPI0034655101
LLLQGRLQERAAYDGKCVLLDNAGSYAEDGSNLESVASAEHLAYVIYTSGTTGKPKGNLTTHRNIVRVVKDTNYIEIGEQDIVLQLSSYAFDGSTFDLYGALLNGAKLVLVSKDNFLEMEKLSQLIEQERISVMFITTALFNVLVDVNIEALRSLRKVLFGGERASVSHVRKALGFLGAGKLIHVYGPTETTVFATYYPVDELAENAVSLPIGRPISNTAAYIVGSGGTLNPIGVSGELWIAGDGVARGYLNRPDVTAEKFIDNPFAQGERMYRTGDLARWLPDGNIEFMGRIDDQVKIRGYRIELGEVEAQLLNVEGVLAATVIAREDEQGQKHLCAYFVPDRELTISDLRSVLSQELPGYMVPAYFVQLDELPLTVNGKVDRKALPAPERDMQTGVDYAEPRTPAEHALVSVWQSVLGIKQVGIKDNFFDLGGDSIKSIQVSSRLLQAGYKLQMKDLFQHPTVAELSLRLQSASSSAFQGDVAGEVKLTPILRWFFEQDQDEPHHFNQAVMLYREQGFEEQALRQVMKKIALHHDALRLVFRNSEDGVEAWNRRSHEGELYTLNVVDFTQETDCAQAVEEKASEIQSGMNLSHGPLMKLGLFRCVDGDHLLICIHHLAVDGVSWRILFEDIAEGYEQVVNGQDIRLPQKTDSFQTWAKQLTAYADSPEMAAERAYWQQVAASGYAVLPKDHEHDNVLTVRDSEVVSILWTDEETDQLLKQAHRAYNTEVNDLLLTALGMAIHALTGIERVPVNLEGHGREQILTDIDITRTVGWFTSQFPVVLEIGKDHSLPQLIKTTKETLRHIPNKGIGYGILKYASLEQDKVEFGTEPEISFNYLGQFDQDLAHSGMQFSPYSIGAVVSDLTTMKYQLDVSGMISGGVLEFTIRYNGKTYDKETMDRLGALLKASLQEVIAHCVAKERTELTPSDVKLKGMTLEQLEQVVGLTRSIGEMENVYALTPLQKGMLFHSLLEPQSGAYFEQATFDLEGTFHIEAFKQSLDFLVQRHHILRTNFYVGLGDQPLQVVFKERKSGFAYEDLRGMGKAEQAAYVADFTKKDKTQGFALGQDALMRVSVLQTGDQSYRFIWSFHHILMDGWCLSLMTGEVFGSYFDFLKQQQPELAPVTPYSQYIEWLDKQNGEEAATYWATYLTGYEQQTLLPKVIQDKQGEYAAEKLIGMLSKELTAGLNLTAKQHQVTINTLMQTAWGIVLQNYNNSSDVVFGSVVSGRPAEIPGVENIIGLFINTIPVRVQCQAGENFVQAMRRNQEQALMSHGYDTYPLFEIQGLSAQKQELINHLMIFENFPVEQQVEQLGSGSEDSQDSFEIANAVLSEQTNYDFNLIVLPGEQIRIDFEYNANAYDLVSMKRMQAHFVHVLEQITANPTIGVHELEVVTAQEKEQILLTFNDTAMDYPREKTIYGLFEEQVERTPDRVAVQFEDEQLTYSELNEQANRMARTLRAEGVLPDDKVGIMVERSLEMIVGIYAILKAGGAYVPIDPEYPAERISFILEDSGAKLLLTQQHLGDRVPAELNSKVIDLNDAGLYAEDGSNLEPLAGPRDVAYVIYTSGSTGKPKGVMIEHHSVINRILWMHERYPIGEADVILQKTAFTFDVSVWELFWWAMVGSSVCMLAVGGEKSPEQILATIERSGVTTMHFVPAMLHAFLDFAEQQPTRKLAEQLGSLRQVFASGEALPPQHVARFQQAVAWINRARLINLYGPTEATVDVSYFDCEPDAAYPVIPIGKPIHNTRLYIVKEGTQQLQPIGVAGELCIAGVGVARGYLNRPELTAEKFTDDPFADGQRMYRTGDLARWLPDGNIEYLGRIDHQVKIRGYRIELGEVESQLLNVEAVLEVVVVAREDELGQKQLCAYYVAAAELTAGELRSRLSETLPSYMVPTYLMQLEQMPLSPNGKIDRKALPAPHGSVRSGAEYAAPRTNLERTLVAIWQAVLGVRTIGIFDNFFDLGGDSIKSIQVSSRLLQAGYKLEMKDLFKYPTVASLSPHVRANTRIADQGEVTGTVQLTPVQRWFFERQQADPHHFNQAVMLHRPEGFDEASLRKTMRKVAEHHDALRMLFHDTGSGIEARYRGVNEGELFDLVIIDLQGESDAASIIDAKSTEIQSSIDLNEGTLLKLGLFRCADGDHLLIAVHHLAVDAVSWRILFEDIATAYEQALKGETIRFPYKTDSFKAWAEQLPIYAASQQLQQQQSYWEQIEQADCRPLPKDFAHNKSLLRDSEVVAIAWTKQETEQLLKQANRAYNTEVNDLLLTALGMAIHGWSGIEQAIVSLEGHGREAIMADIDVTRTVGWFTSIYPVVLKTSPDRSLSQRIKQTKEQLHCMPYKGIGYGILRYLAEDPVHEGKSRFTAEPEISFNYLGQIDQDLQEHDIRLSPHSGGESTSANAELRYALDLNGMISQGELQFTIRYSGKEYRKETIERLASCLQMSLQDVIAHCLSKKQPELTVSDVSLKGLSQEELEQFVEQTAAIGDLENIYALTPMQKGILFHSLMDSDSGAYFEQSSFDLEGKFDVEAFAQSFDMLVNRHEALRTSFYTGWKEDPVQVVFRNRPGKLIYADLCEMSAEDREAYIVRFTGEDKKQGFDLAQDTLLRVSILRTDADVYRIVWSFHHIVMDGWCLSLVAKEVFDIYFAILARKEPELPEVLPYSQYIEWLELQDNGEASSYWSGYLAGYEQQSLLPSGKQPNKGTGYVSQRLDVDLGAELTGQIHGMAKRLQVTANTLVQSIWGILLQRYNGNEDVVFGSVVSGRPEEIPGVEQIVGLFINTIPVRIRCEAKETFADVMKRTQEQAIASHAYDTFPLYDIQASTEQKHELVNHIVIFENYPVEEQIEQLGSEDDTGFKMTGVETVEQTNYDFNLVILPGDAMKIYVGYNEMVFDKASIQRIQSHLVGLLKQVVANPEIGVSELEVITEDEKAQIFDEFNATAMSSP